MSSPDLSVLAAGIEAALRARGTPERAEKERAYLKSSLTHLGVTVPATREVVKAFRREHPDLDAGQVRALVVRLWDADIYERRLAAVLLLLADTGRGRPEDLALIERLIRESRTWALVDELAANIAGDLIERYPQLSSELDRWAADDDFWVRRAALLALLGPLRRGGGDWDHFVRLAEPMLGEREFFIRKAIGWILRETGKRRPELVAAYLRPRLTRVSGLTLREAVKRLPPELRDELLAEARARREGRFAPT